MDNCTHKKVASSAVMTQYNGLVENQELPFLAAIFTVFLCALFGANAVAIKISLSGLGVFTTAGLRFSMASVAVFIWARITGRSFHIKKGQIHRTDSSATDYLHDVYGATVTVLSRNQQK